MKKPLGMAITPVEGNRSEVEVIIHGKVDVDKLENLMTTFISKHILCPKCKLPEWTGKSCKACAYSKVKTIQENDVHDLDFSPDNVQNLRVGDDKEDKINPFDIEVSAVMHRLYDLRESRLNDQEFVSFIDQAIDKCWKVSQKNWPILLPRINQTFFEN